MQIRHGPPFTLAAAVDFPQSSFPQQLWQFWQKETEGTFRCYAQIGQNVGFFWQAHMPGHICTNYYHSCLAPLISRIYETHFTGSELAKICYTCNALADVIEGWFFHHFIIIEISWGSAEKIIKIRPTVAEQSDKKNTSPIVYANP